MNDHMIIQKCATFSRRHCEQEYGISQKVWDFARKFGELPDDRRGRPENTELTDHILLMVKDHPNWNSTRYALELGCSEWKVKKVMKENKLSRTWQRLKYAGIELQEMDPDLVKARKNKIKADGPGALVQIDSKTYNKLKGGKPVVGYVIIDNYSGFMNVYLSPDGRKTGENAVNALNAYKAMFPVPIRKIYSDNGSEFINKDVKKWTADMGIPHKTTRPAHPFSNGKTERANGMVKKEMFLELMTLIDEAGERVVWEDIPPLQEALNVKVQEWNYTRPYFGGINKGLTPFVVASECVDLSEEERTARLEELLKSMKAKNRAQWEKEKHQTDHQSP